MRIWMKRCMAVVAGVTVAIGAGSTASAFNSQDEEWAIADNWSYVGGEWKFTFPAQREAQAQQPQAQQQQESQQHAQSATGDAAVPGVSIMHYQVNAGDTLYQISRAFGITVNELLAANSLDNPNRLSVGQRLDIPQLEAGWSGDGERPIVQRVLSSTLTAYTAGKESTGKTPSHPAYGITRSGSKAEEGRTVAVDPSIIPLGSTVLIEGIGIRKAEDTGSAIRGARIDVYMNDLKEAVQFGVKKNVKVFVLEDSSV